MKDAADILYSRIDALLREKGRVLAAVDGMAASGKTTLCENLREESYQGGGFSSIYEFVTRMEQHPEYPFSVEEAARKCFLSDTSFRAKFRQITGGFTPTEYRNRLWIDRADAMIGTGNFTLDAVAEMLGFWDTAHFCRVYKKLRGHTPGGR